MTTQTTQTTPMRVDIGLISLSIDRLERMVDNFEKIKDRIWVDKECDRGVVIDLIKDFDSIKDHIEYHKELNRDIPRIPKTF